MSIDEIIAGMTEAQRDAMRGVFSWSTDLAQEIGEEGLIKLGLWASYGRNGKQHLTPLGEAVRARLEEQSND